MSTSPAERRRWLLLVYRISSGSSSRRTYVWRQLRQLGAVYLQQAVAVLPDRPELHAGLDRLGQRIRTTGGEASLLETVSPGTAWEDELVARFNVARDAEYEELVENVERFEDEIRRESRKKRFLFPELEEGEAEWAKLRRWFARVTERDFFGAVGRADAEASLARGRGLLDVFVREVYRHEGLEGAEGAEAAGVKGARAGGRGLEGRAGGGGEGRRAGGAGGSCRR